MGAARIYTSAFLAGCFGLASLACAGDPSRAQAPPPSDPPATASTVVAQVGSQTITLDDVDRKALLANANEFGALKLRDALYESRRRTLDQLVAERLFEQEAKARGLAVPALLDREVRSKLTPVTDASVEEWYRDNPGRVRNVTLDQVKGPIRELLEQEQTEAALGAFVEVLKTKIAVRVALEPPRQEVRIAAHDPSMGPATAAVQIVEFSDFQ
jgi:hypothetical protein